MAARGVVMQARASRTATVATQEIGRHAALIKKHVLRSLVQGQPVAPVAALRRDVSAALFVGVNGFF